MKQTLQASNTQKQKLTQIFQQLFAQDPMYSKLGGYITPLLQNSVHFYFHYLPLKPEVVVRELEVAGQDDPEEVKYYKFGFTWQHPCIRDYSITIEHEIPVEDFEAFI